MRFDQLSETEVPPAPEDLAQQVHHRLNRVLVMMHIGDFLLRAVPTASLTFVKPVLAFFRYSCTGRFGQRTGRR
ncbi:MAG: hypothetical protein WBF93_18910 [Pirellulales bacterium]|nr:hypothetical protein [Pirellulales bacterium]